MNRNDAVREYAMALNAEAEARRQIDVRETRIEGLLEKAAREEDAKIREEMRGRIEKMRRRADGLRREVRELERRRDEIGRRNGLSEKDIGQARRIAGRIQDTRKADGQQAKEPESASGGRGQEAGPKRRPAGGRGGRDLAAEIADARERLHILEDHTKNALNRETENIISASRARTGKRI